MNIALADYQTSSIFKEAITSPQNPGSEVVTNPSVQKLDWRSQYPQESYFLETGLVYGSAVIHGKISPLTFSGSSIPWSSSEEPRDLLPLDINSRPKPTKSFKIQATLRKVEKKSPKIFKYENYWLE
jgi:hypothetical protein